MKFKIHKNEDKGPTIQNNYNRITLKKIVGFSFFLVICIGFITFFAFQIKWFYDNFEEVKFALKKPSIVKMVREDYEKKQKELEQSYTRKGETPEQKLIEQVVKKLQKKEDF